MIFNDYMTKTKAVLAVAGFATAMTLPSLVQAASYPERPVTIVVPFPAGGTPDIIARVLGEKAGADLGQAVIVENRGGAGGNIGMQYVSRAAADGYTLAMCAYSCAVAPSLYKPAPYDISAQFEPVVMVGTVPSVLVVNPKTPAKNLQEFIAYAKANPNKLNAASSGIGGSAHLALEMLKREAGVEIEHIPYKGAGQVAGDLLSGQVDMYFDNLPASLPHIKSGSLRALAVASKDRSETIGDVPTFVESGLPKMLVTPWFGILTPKGTPPESVQRLNAAFNKALTDPAVQKRLTDLGVDLVGGSTQVLADFLSNETRSLATLIEQNNISAN
jgi:tripartite-type tricarboxylate transporter receptor subunit TctC